MLHIEIAGEKIRVQSRQTHLASILGHRRFLLEPKIVGGIHVPKIVKLVTDDRDVYVNAGKQIVKQLAFSKIKAKFYAKQIVPA